MTKSEWLLLKIYKRRRGEKKNDEVKRLESIAKSHLNKVFEYDKNQLPIV